MTKTKVYLDTSVISYLYQLDAPEKMQQTLLLWDSFCKNERFEIYISDIVLSEISQCNAEKLQILLDYLSKIDYNIIETDEQTIHLAEKFIDFGILRLKSFDDCQHIAAAILAECDIITSWNFKHMVNVKTMNGVRILTTREGYKDISICSPETLLKEVPEHDETNTQSKF